MIRFLLALLVFGLSGTASAADRSFIVSSFDRIRIDGPFDVELTTGASPGARASGDQRALDALTIRVEGNTLIVSMGAGSWSDRHGGSLAAPLVTLSTPNLRTVVVNSGARLAINAMKGQKLSLAVNGSGTLTIAAIDAQELETQVVGVGNVTLAGHAARARFTISGPGTVNAEKLEVNDLTARSDGPGEAHFAARYTANITTTGLGPVTVAGSASCTVNAVAGGPVTCGAGLNDN